ncbi:hypothetical protein FRC11_007544 [Ceratobasidium sp. 423]|nr:hypothetical protein FRC11_007544 [Ceratobasidium sp. 423]
MMYIGYPTPLTREGPCRARRPKTPSPSPETDEDDGDQYQPSSEPDPPKKKVRQDTSAQRSEVPEHSSEDELEDESEPEREPPKKRSRRDKRAQSLKVSGPDPKVKKSTGNKKATFKSVPKPTGDKSHSSKTSEETAPPSEPIVDGTQIVKVTKMKLHIPTGRVTRSNKNKS